VFKGVALTKKNERKYIKRLIDFDLHNIL